MALCIAMMALAPLLACVDATPSSDTVLLVQQHVRDHVEPNASSAYHLELPSASSALTKEEEQEQELIPGLSGIPGIPGLPGLPGRVFPKRAIRAKKQRLSRRSGVLFMGLLSGMSFEKIMLDMVYPRFRQEQATDLEMGDCDQGERAGLWRGALHLSALVQLMGFEGAMKQLPEECTENMMEIPDRSLDPENGPVKEQPLTNLDSMTSCLEKTFMVNSKCAMCQAKFMQMSETCTPNCAGLRHDCSWASYGSKSCMISAAKCVGCSTAPWREHFQCLGGMPQRDLDEFFTFLSYWTDFMKDESVLNHRMMGDVVKMAMDKVRKAKKARKAKVRAARVNGTAAGMRKRTRRLAASDRESSGTSD